MRKLMWFAIGFCLASFVGCAWLDTQWFFLAAGVSAVCLASCLIIMLRLPKARVVGMLVFGCIIGFLWQMGYDHSYLSPARAADEYQGELTIFATDYSYKTNYGSAVSGKVTLNGKTYAIRIYLPEDIVIYPGDSISGKLTIRCTLPSCSRPSDYYRSNGTFLLAYPGDEINITTANRFPVYGYPAMIRQSMIGLLEEIFDEDVSGFARALLLGDTDGIDYETDTAFKLSGIRHVIAVSGLHVSILFSLVYFFTGRRKWLTAIVGIPVLFFFAAVAGFSPSITRACIMHSLTVIALLFDKEYDPPSALAFAVTIMLVVNPWTVTNVGFQLSVGCMVGIFLFAERIQRWLLEKKRLGQFHGLGKKLAGWFSVSVAISISATIFTVPLCAYYFGMVSLVGIVTNLLTLWIITYVFYGIMLACVAYGIFYPIGIATAWVVSWGIRYVLWVAKVIASLPFAAVYTCSPYIVLWLVFCYVLLAVFLLLRKKRPLILGCCAAIGLSIALMASWLEQNPQSMRMTVLDVGQGQCILLQSDGKNYLVDCGGDSDTAAADKAAALLLSMGIRRLDGMIITHYDSDHAGGVIYLLQRLQVDTLFLPNSLDADGNALLLQNYRDSRVLMIGTDVELTFGETKITLIPSENAITDNESGLCVLFQREDCDILITGDRSSRGELELIRHITLPDLEVLIVGHHGSKYSTSRELLIKTTPDIAIISVGADNSFGHPTQEVLDRLEKYGCIVYRTDRDGTVVFRG